MPAPLQNTWRENQLLAATVADFRNRATTIVTVTGQRSEARLSQRPRSRRVGDGRAAVLDVLLESRRNRQAVDEIQTDVTQHGELAEVLQRVHAAEPRDRVEKADGGRQEAGRPRQQVVEAAAGVRRRHGVLDEVDDRRRRRVAAAAAAADSDAARRRQRLRTETESTCTRPQNFPPEVHDPNHTTSSSSSSSVMK